MANLEQLVDDLSKLTVLEAAELSTLLEEKWGVSAAAPVAMAAAHAAASFMHELRGLHSRTCMSAIRICVFGAC